MVVFIDTVDSAVELPVCFEAVALEVKGYTEVVCGFLVCMNNFFHMRFLY